MNDLDLNTLLGPEDDEGSPRRRSRASAKRGGGGRRRRRRRNRGGFIAPLLAFVILAGIIGGGGYFGYMWLNDALVPDDFTGQGSGGEVVIEIKAGQSASEVAQELEKQGVVASARAFTNAIANANMSASLQPGEYKMRKGMSAASAAAALVHTNRLLAKVTIEEGLRLSQTLSKLAEATGKPLKEFQAAAKKGDDLDLPSYAKGRLEGYAFPATYEFQPKDTPKEILAAMVKRFNQTADTMDLEDGAKELGFKPQEIIVIASIVQAEAGRQEDMAKIARVIYNRLALPMKLQMDSTTMYALGKFRTKATFAETEVDHPYNTYFVEGLPPGAITNPGDHAIEAALNPAKGTWRFFVATNPKSNVTEFATTETEFQQLEAKLRANGG